MRNRKEVYGIDYYIWNPITRVIIYIEQKTQGWRYIYVTLDTKNSKPLPILGLRSIRNSAIISFAQ